MDLGPLHGDGDGDGLASVGPRSVLGHYTSRPSEIHLKARPAGAWENCMSMEEPHAHMTEPTESISAFFVYFNFGLFFSLSVHQFSSYQSDSGYLVPRFL
jgi:hypothetical protein